MICSLGVLPQRLGGGPAFQQAVATWAGPGPVLAGDQQRGRERRDQRSARNPGSQQPAFVTVGPFLVPGDGVERASSTEHLLRWSAARFDRHPNCWPSARNGGPQGWTNGVSGVQIKAFLGQGVVGVVEGLVKVGQQLFDALGGAVVAFDLTVPAAVGSIGGKSLLDPSTSA